MSSERWKGIKREGRRGVHQLARDGDDSISLFLSFSRFFLRLSKGVRGRKAGRVSRMSHAGSFLLVPFLRSLHACFWDPLPLVRNPPPSSPSSSSSSSSSLPSTLPPSKLLSRCHSTCVLILLFIFLPIFVFTFVLVYFNPLYIRA